MQKTNHLCVAVRWDYRPLGFETTGGLGQGARAFFKKLVRRVALQSSLPAAEVAGALAQRISVTLAKGCAEMLVKGFALF